MLVLIPRSWESTKKKFRSPDFLLSMEVREDRKDESL